MSTEIEDFPYKTYLNILHGPLELIDVQKLADACKDKWWNQTLCKVNDAVVRLGIVEGEYHWHEHSDIDEFFYVIEGRSRWTVEGEEREAGPGDILVEFRLSTECPFEESALGAPNLVGKTVGVADGDPCLPLRVEHGIERRDDRT